MKVTVLALVVRDKRDNHIVDVYPIEDMYDHVTVKYATKYVTPEEIKKHIDSWVGPDSIQGARAHANLTATGVWYDRQEAKDFSDVGFLQIGVESKEVDMAGYEKIIKALDEVRKGMGGEPKISVSTVSTGGNSRAEITLNVEFSFTTEGSEEDVRAWFRNGVVLVDKLQRTSRQINGIKESEVRW